MRLYSVWYEPDDIKAEDEDHARQISETTPKNIAEVEFIRELEHAGE